MMMWNLPWDYAPTPTKLVLRAALEGPLSTHRRHLAATWVCQLWSECAEVKDDRVGHEAAIGPGMGKVADEVALAAAGPRAEGPLSFEDGCMSWERRPGRSKIRE